jgi:hypothetical protein
MEAFVIFMRHLLEEEQPKERFEAIVKEINDLFVLRPSEKHLSGIEIILEPPKYIAV